MSKIVLMAGGTGGHLFPAVALAQELVRREHDTYLITDRRVTQYGGQFPARKIFVVPSATPSIRNPFDFLKAIATILGGIAKSWPTLRKIDPDVVIGFGGYPTFPPFLAASLMGFPGILHEQNAVLGRANRALARFGDALALTFDPTRDADRFRIQRTQTGNPVRDEVIAAGETPYPKLTPKGPVRLLVFGGSQGARAFSELVPPAVAALPGDIKARLVVTQQCRPEDLDAVAEQYRAAKVNVELAPFFDDLPQRMAQSHLVIGRAGASTVSELTAIGRPSILVPLPGSLDQDQLANARVIEAGGGGWVAEQATLSPQSLGNRLAELLGDRDVLQSAADAAKKLGQPQAVSRLADLVEQVAARG
jgi:UDP-N-acetylglucosamine--N-acetylmuramyl-(pentapeptide) pyrophosphoryl-undecaprenol N-acetylglucosamine transferase